MLNTLRYTQGKIHGIYLGNIYGIHPKPKIRKSIFLQGQEISYFSAAVSGSISYFLMFLGVGFLHGNVSSFGIRFFVSCCDAKFPRFDSFFRTSMVFTG